MKMIKEIEDGDTFSVPPELVNHFKSTLIQGQTRVEIEGLEIEKGKYPPFEGNVPTLAQWKRTDKGKDHFSIVNNSKKNDSEIANQIGKMLELQQAVLSAPPARVSDVSMLTAASGSAATTAATGGGRIGTVIIHTGRVDVKIAYSSNFTEEKGKQVPLSISLQNLIKKAKKWKGYDKEKKKEFLK